MMKNPKEEVRRRALRHIIDTEHRGNKSAFARKAGKSQPQISDMLAGTKSFGEKVARGIEKKAQLSAGILDVEPEKHEEFRTGKVSGVAEPLMRYGLPISPEACDLGREWEKLREPLRSQLQQFIETLVAEQVREARKPKGKPPTKGKDDHPRPS